MIVTTSRYASRVTRDFAKKLKGEYLARGKRTVHQLVDTAWKKGHNRILVVEEQRKKPRFVIEVLINHWGKWKWGKKSEVE